MSVATLQLEHQVLQWSGAMLSTTEFLMQCQADASDGIVVLVFLSSFRPIGQEIGIPAVYRASDHLAALIEELAPHDSIIGKLSSWTYTVFISGASIGDGQRLATKIRVVAESRQFALTEDAQGPLYVAIGVVEKKRSDHDFRQIVRAAAALAEQDQGRHPEGWKYPIVLPDVDNGVR